MFFRPEISPVNLYNIGKALKGMVGKPQWDNDGKNFLGIIQSGKMNNGLKNIAEEIKILKGKKYKAGSYNAYHQPVFSFFTFATINDSSGGIIDHDQRKDD